MTNYDNRIRPVGDQMRIVQLDVSLSLFSINDVDEVKEKLTSTGYLTVYWQDEILRWDFSVDRIDFIYLKQVRILI
jgi:hypothetical protein